MCHLQVDSSENYNQLNCDGQSRQRSDTKMKSNEITSYLFWSAHLDQPAFFHVHQILKTYNRNIYSMIHANRLSLCYTQLPGFTNLLIYITSRILHLKLFPTCWRICIYHILKTLWQNELDHNEYLFFCHNVFNFLK